MSAGFASQLSRIGKKIERRHGSLFVQCVDEAFESIVIGSEITGAPGQPVGQYGEGYHPGKVGGALRASWQKRFVSPTQAIISTKLVYAKPIEEGMGQWGKLTLRSTVGGFHSVKKTRIHFKRIVKVCIARVRGQT